MIMQGVPTMMLMANASQCTAESNTSRSSLSNRSSPSDANGATVQSTLISRAGRTVISTFSPITTTMNANNNWNPDANNPFHPHKHRIISSSNATTPLSRSQISQFPASALCFQQQHTKKTFPAQQFDQERVGDNEKAQQSKQQQQQQYFQGTYHHLGQMRFQDASAASTANSSLCNPSPEQLNFRKKIKRTIDCSNINQQQQQQQQQQQPITNTAAHPFKFQRSQSTRLGNALQKSRNQASQISINNNNLNNYPQHSNAITNSPSQVDCIPLAITGEQIHMSNNNHHHGRYGLSEQIHKSAVLPLRSNKNHYRRHHRYGNLNNKFNNNINSNQGDEDVQQQEDEGKDDTTKNYQNKHNHQAFWNGNSTQKEEAKEEEEEEEKSSENKQSFSQSVVVGTGITCKAGLLNYRKHQDLFSHRNNRRNRYQQQANQGNILEKQEQLNQQQLQNSGIPADIAAQQGIFNTNQENLVLSLNNDTSHGLGKKTLKRQSYNSRRDTRTRLLNQQKDRDQGVEEGIREQEIGGRIDQNTLQRRDFEEYNVEQQLESYQKDDRNYADNRNNKDTSQSELVSSPLDQEGKDELMQMLLRCSDYEKDDRELAEQQQQQQLSRQQFEQYNSQQGLCECNSQGNSYVVNDDNEIQGDIDDMFKEIEGVYADLEAYQGRDIRQSDGSGMQSDVDDDEGEGEECCSNEISLQYDYQPAAFCCYCGGDNGEEYYGDNIRLSCNCVNQEDEGEEGNEDLEGQFYHNDEEQHGDEDDDYNMHEQYSEMINDIQSQYEGLNLLRHHENDSDGKQQDDNDQEEGLNGSKLNSSSQHSESYHNTSESHEDDDQSFRKFDGSHDNDNDDSEEICSQNQDNEDQQSLNDSENSRLRQQSQQWSDDNQIGFNNDSEVHSSRQTDQDEDDQANQNEDDEDSRLYYDLYPRMQSQQLVPLRSSSSNLVSGGRSYFEYENYEGNDGDDENQEQVELAMPEMNLSLYNQHVETENDYDNDDDGDNNDNNNNNNLGGNHSEERGEESINADDDEEYIINYRDQIEVDDPFSNFFHSITIGSFVRSQLNHLLSDMQLDDLDMHEFNDESQSQQFYIEGPMDEDEEMIMPEYYEENIPLMLTDEQIENMKTTFYHANHPHKTCAICLSDFNVQEHLRELPCTHHFHVDCVDDWLRIKPSCPLCRQNFLEQEEMQQEEEELEQEEEEELEQLQ